MSLPLFKMRELLEAGVHFGHNPRRWNPKMAPYLYGVRNGIHIINLEKTVPLLKQAMEVARDIVAQGGRVLFVGTKRQASQIFADSAQKCGQYYVNHRWLGGMLTNWKTVSNSIKRLKDLREKFEGDTSGFTKKELLTLERQVEKLEKALGGIKEMGGVPDLLFVVDTLREMTAIKEAKKLGIPVIAVVDSNSDPDFIDYPIPGNDDASRSIEVYCRLVSGSILEGLQNQMLAAGVDLGASEKGMEELDETLLEIGSIEMEVSEDDHESDGEAEGVASKAKKSQTKKIVESKKSAEKKPLVVEKKSVASKAKSAISKPKSSAHAHEKSEAKSKATEKQSTKAASTEENA